MYKKPEDIKPLPPGMMDAFDKAVTSQMSEYDKPLDQRGAPEVEAPASEEPLQEAKGEEYEADSDHDMDPKSHVMQDKETGMFCVYDANSKKVAEFKTKQEAEKYAIDNHDDLMKKEVVKEDAKTLTAVRDHGQGKQQYIDVNSKATQELKKNLEKYKSDAEKDAKDNAKEVEAMDKMDEEAELIGQLHEALDANDEEKVKEIIGKLKGASKAHAGQAKDLEKAVKEEDETTAAKTKAKYKSDAEKAEKEVTKDAKALASEESDDDEKLDKVNPKAVKKKFDDRKDKDIDNDGDVDSSDKYLHKRRQAISKAIKNEETTLEAKYPKAARGKASVGYPHAPRGMRWKTLIPMRGKTTIVNYHQAVKDYGKDNVHYTKGGMKTGEDQVQVLLPESTHDEYLHKRRQAISKAIEKQKMAKESVLFEDDDDRAPLANLKPPADDDNPHHDLEDRIYDRLRVLYKRKYDFIYDAKKSDNQSQIDNLKRHAADTDKRIEILKKETDHPSTVDDARKDGIQDAKKVHGIRESLDESKALVQKAITVAKKLGGNMTKAVKEIEKMQRGLSKDKAVASALQLANEHLEEGTITVHDFTGKGPDPKSGVKITKLRDGRYGGHDVKMSGPDDVLVSYAKRSLGVDSSAKTLSDAQKQIDRHNAPRRPGFR